MSNEECEKVLKELEEVRPEKLNDRAKRLFESIMLIVDKKEQAEADLYEANNRINDLLDIVKQKDELINLMSKDIYDTQIECYRYFKDIEDVKKYFKERGK